MKIITTNKASAAIGPYSQAVSHGGFVFTSGQVPLSPQTGEVVGCDIASQAEQALTNLTAVLEAAGSGPDQVVKTTCFLADMADFAAFNTVYARFFGQSKPARSCVAVKDLPRGVLVEIEAIAAVHSE
ncbi:MAG: RidA family protein [Oscillospiraceae bacterium]|nr:RidA family protein [Oscillospiraceae bacterium]